MKNTITVDRHEWELQDHALAVISHELAKAQGGIKKVSSSAQLFKELDA